MNAPFQQESISLDQLKVGGGTGGSKSALVASQAFLEAGDKVIERGKQIAAVTLSATDHDLVVR